MVQHVGDDPFKFQAYAFSHTDRLSQAEVHVPVREAVENTSPAISGIETQNRVPILVGCSRSVFKDVIRQLACAAKARRVLGRIEVSMAALNRSDWYRVLLAAEVVIVAGAELFAVAGRGVHLVGRSRTGREDARDRPPTQQTTHKAVLCLIEGR